MQNSIPKSSLIIMWRDLTSKTEYTSQPPILFSVKHPSFQVKRNLQN